MHMAIYTCNDIGLFITQCCAQLGHRSIMCSPPDILEDGDARSMCVGGWDVETKYGLGVHRATKRSPSPSMGSESPVKLYPLYQIP